MTSLTDTSSVGDLAQQPDTQHWHQSPPQFQEQSDTQPWQQTSPQFHEQTPEQPYFENNRFRQLTPQTISPTQQVGQLGDEHRAQRRCVARVGQNTSGNEIHGVGLTHIAPLPATSQDRPMVVSQSGPMSSSHLVPPRPKPGRKPIAQDNAVDRRRLQNRTAQRNFRDKRQQKLSEALQDLERIKAESRAAEIRYESGLMELQENLRKATNELQSTRKRADQAEQDKRQLMEQLKSKDITIATLTPMLSRPLPSASMAPNPEETTHTGFTHHSRQADVPRDSVDYSMGEDTESIQQADVPRDSVDYSMGEDTEGIHCGFCTNNPYSCICRSPPEVERIITGPGSCILCRKDPQRAQACRDIAKSLRMAESSSPTSPPDDSQQRAPRVSCSKMVESVIECVGSGSIAGIMDGFDINVYPKPDGGYEFDDRDAAEALSNLSRQEEKNVVPLGRRKREADEQA